VCVCVCVCWHMHAPRGVYSDMGTEWVDGVLNSAKGKTTRRGQRTERRERTKDV